MASLYIERCGNNKKQIINHFHPICFTAVWINSKREPNTVKKSEDMNLKKTKFSQKLVKLGKCSSWKKIST